MKKRLLSLFCTFALLVGLVPTVAFAADDTGQAIQFVDNGTAANIIGGQAANISSIYFGTYQQSSAGDTQPSGAEGVYWIRSDTAIKNNMGPYYFIEPVKWLVLKNENNELFLLSDQILDRMEYNKVDGKIKWSQSTIRSWLNGLNENNGMGEGPIDYASDNFLDTAFSDKEQAVIQSETIEGKNDKISLLSYTNSLDMPQEKKKATVTDYSIGLGSNDIMWWMRPTASQYMGNTYSMFMSAAGQPTLNSTRLTYFHGVRPAFHLDLNSVLFTSAAVGGKSSGAVGADALKQVEPYDGSEWKMTLADDSRNSFSASVAAHSGNIAYIDYNGAAAGTNEYISALVTDADNTIQYYGRIAKSTASDGSAGIDVSSVPSGDTLSVFSEQYNGDKMTDYASNLVQVDLQGYENTPDAYGITNTLDNLTNSNSAGYRLQSEDSDYTATLVPDSGYMLPETITVTVNGTSLIQGTDYTYDSETGQLTIMASAITGPIVITAAGIEKTYGISALPTDLNFGSITAGYPEAPTAQTVTITNTGNHALTVNLPGSTNYTVTEGTGFVNGIANLAPNGTATFTVQPITGLDAGSYRESLNISGSDGSNGASAEVELRFAVTQQTGGGGSSGGSSTSTTTSSQQAIDKIESAKSGEVVKITLSTGNTKLDQEFFEKLAGRDVTLEISLPNGALWTVNGLDIPENADLSDLDLGVDMGTSSIPVTVFNAITGEVETTQFTLKHNSEFGFTMTLTASLDKEYADLWANLYYYNARTGELEFQSAHKIGANGTVGLPLTHGGQYAIVIDDRDHTSKAFPFADVKESDWYYDAVDFVYQNELMNGTSTSRFDPNGTMNRAMLVTILHRQAGEPVVNYALPLDDVTEGTWYTEAVRWAASEGVVTGTTETAFAPDSSITREQFATILYRYAQQSGADVSVGETTNILSYADALDVSEYAIPAMQWACGAGIVEGSGANLNPQGQTTRAEAAIMLMRLIQTVA